MSAYILSTILSFASVSNACTTSAKYWSISNAATLTCPGGGERFPEPSWRVGDLKFYSDDACSSQLHPPIRAMARGSYAHWTPDKAFDGSVDTDWRDLDYSKKGDLDTYWIGGEFYNAVTVRCVKIYQGYNCAGNQNCGGKGWHWVDSVNVRSSDDGVNWTTVGTISGLGCESQQAHTVGCGGGGGGFSLPSQISTTTAPPTFPPVPSPSPIRDEESRCSGGVATGRFWSISNNQAFTCSPDTRKVRFPEASWRVNELKFYADSGCQHELTVFKPLGGGSAWWWTYSNSRGGRDVTNPDYAFDGTSDYYRAMDTYTNQHTDKLWIGADLGSSVTVRCIKLNQGYSCDMNDYCGNRNGWQTVDSVNLRYSEDGVNWTNVKEKITGLGCEEDLSSQNGYPINPACPVKKKTVPPAWWCVYFSQSRRQEIPACNGSGRRLEGEAEPDFAMAPTPEEMEAFKMEAQ